MQQPVWLGTSLLLTHVHVAAKLGVTPEELAVASIEKLLARPEDCFEEAVEYVLKKNTE